MLHYSWGFISIIFITKRTWKALTVSEKSCTTLKGKPMIPIVSLDRVPKSQNLLFQESFCFRNFIIFNLIPLKFIFKTGYYHTN